MMPIQRTVDVRPLDMPLEMPFRIAYDTITHARNVLVNLDGAFGEGAPVPSITGETQQQVLADLHAGAPVTAAGRCAWDTANWDRAARDDGVPLCTALTGAVPKPIASSITIPLVDQSEIGALVERRLSEGFSIFKVKAGLSVADDVQRIATIRDAIGDRELRVDANQGWALVDAASALAVLADLNVSVLEQPLGRDDIAGHAELRRLSGDISGPAIMLDESVFDAADAERAIDAGAADWINIKLQKSGGLTEGLRIAELAADNDVPCMVGCMLESRVAILHAAHLGAAHPNIQKADLDGAVLLRDDPVVGGGRYADGYVMLDHAPGIGVTEVRA